MTNVAVPDLARREVAHQRHRAADVIGIAVRDGEVVQPPDAARAQRRAEHAIADVEVAAHRHAAGVDHQRPAVRQRHEHRIALPHVHHRQMQPAVAERRAPSVGGAIAIQSNSAAAAQRPAAPTF